MTNEERITKLEESLCLHQEALVTIRKIIGLQEQRMENLENFMRGATGVQQNPYVGVPPSDL